MTGRKDRQERHMKLRQESKGKGSRNERKKRQTRMANEVKARKARITHKKVQGVIIKYKLKQQEKK